MFAFYNPLTKEYAHVEAEIGYEQHCDDPSIQYSFVTIGGTMYTSVYREQLQKILDIRDGNSNVRFSLGSLDAPCDIKYLQGYKIVEIGHVEQKYRIKTEISTGYEITYRDFDGNLDECIAYMDDEVRTASSNGLLKGIFLEIDGAIHREKLYDVTKFLMQKKYEGE